MTKVAIIGLGLIGGSLGLALKKFGGSDWHVTGYSRRPETARQAVQLGATDRAETSLDRAVSDADLVVLATPIGATRGILSEVAPLMKAGCVVSDTCSTKREVMEWAKSSLPPGVEFIGGHPMAGKETWGLGVADAELFVGATYCLVPSAASTAEALAPVTRMAQTVHARPFVVTAEAHDHMVGGISHLPLVLSSVLVNATQQDPMWPDMALLAAGGYRDTTRVASGNPDMGRDICLTNREEVLAWIDKFTARLSEFRKKVDVSDADAIESELKRARQGREAWFERRYERGG